ncbi:hypothetical protein TNCV_926011 [Trichonephila clavipes]|nr:hypothetical protein TNCV_926011 [Trichonephila clavipes]
MAWFGSLESKIPAEVSPSLLERGSRLRALSAIAFVLLLSVRHKAIKSKSMQLKTSLGGLMLTILFEIVANNGPRTTFWMMDYAKEPLENWKKALVHEKQLNSKVSSSLLLVAQFRGILFTVPLMRHGFIPIDRWRLYLTHSRSLEIPPDMDQAASSLDTNSNLGHHTDQANVVRGVVAHQIRCSQLASLHKNNALREIKLRSPYLQGKSTTMSIITHQTEKEWISANEKNRQIHAEGAAEQHAARLEEAHLRAHHSCFTTLERCQPETAHLHQT